MKRDDLYCDKRLHRIAEKRLGTEVLCHKCKKIVQKINALPQEDGHYLCKSCEIGKKDD